QAMRAAPGAKTGKARATSGPLQAFEAALSAAGDGASAALLEAFATYLLVTGGDAAESHEARDYARRAAEKVPTVDRLILAAKLAEDRNGAAVFVRKAKALPYQTT